MTVPPLGVVTHAVGHEPMPFSTCLDKIAATSAEHILLLTSPAGPPVVAGGPVESHFPDVLKSDPTELRRMVEATGLRIGGLLPMVVTDVSSDSSMETTKQTLAQYVQAADLLGCHTMCISAPRPHQEAMSPMEKRDTLRRLASLMDSIVEQSTSADFTISVDIHYGSLVESQDDSRFLVGEMKERRAGLLLNMGHLTTVHEAGWRLIEEFPDRVHVVAWKDHSTAEDRPRPVYSVELGTGDTPFNEYSRALTKHDHCRPVHFVNVEHAPLGDEVPTMQRSIRYLRNLLATQD